MAVLLPCLVFMGAVMATTVHADCGTAPYASCGSDAAGVSCCPDGYYCQPWDAGFYQCMNLPAQCGQQYANIDFYGDDLETVYGIQPSECCTKCAETDGCVAYTFVNSNPGQPACYLKSGMGTQKDSVGAVSGVVTTNPTTPAPTDAPTPTPTSSDCTTDKYGYCGNSDDTTCCPNGFYCQPWSDAYYQCIQPPSQCPTQETDVDYYGNDLKTMYVSLPSLCCDACANTDRCKAYTYINNNPGQPVCYLKSAAGNPRTLVGAVSGQLN